MFKYCIEKSEIMCYYLEKCEVIEMERTALQDLIKWKSSEDRKLMVLKGARHVGKTWLMKEFGKSCYNHCVYITFDEENELKTIFEINKEPHRIIELLSMIFGKKYCMERH